MNDVKPYPLTISAIRISIAISLLLTAAGVYLLLSWARVDSFAQTKATPLLVAAEALNQRIMAQRELLQACALQPSCAITQDNIEKLREALTQFRSVASENKSEVSLVGAVEYTALELALNRFQASAQSQEDRLTLYIELTSSFQQIEANYAALVTKISTDTLMQKNRFFIWLMGIIAVLVAVAFVSNLWTIMRLRQSNANERKVVTEFEQLARELQKIDAERLDTLLNDTSINRQQRQIYARLKRTFSDLENQKRANDLYKQLYSLIGYEIRGITNTISGGVQYLSSDNDKNGQAMVKEVTTAAQTLAELAENYNRLISQGADSKAHEFSLLSLLSELMLHVNAKAMRNQTPLETLFDETLPSRVEGRQTQLFWVLFLQIADAISRHATQPLFISVTSGAAADAGKTQLTLSLHFLTSFDIALNKLSALHWRELETPTGSKDDLANAVLGSEMGYHSQWHQSGKQVRFQLHFDVKAKNFHASNALLENKKLMLCSEYALRRDVLHQTLTRAGADVSLVSSPAELLTQHPHFHQFDALLLADCFEPSKLRSLAKTVQKQCMQNEAQHGLRPQLIVYNNTLYGHLSHSTNDGANALSPVPFIDAQLSAPMMGFESLPQLASILAAAQHREHDQPTRFLIVEDDRVQQILLKRILAKQEYNADSVSDGADAVAYIMKQRSDIIFMDCIMPGMNGIEATKRIRQFEKNEGISPCTIIGATALSSQNEHQSCIAAGMDFVVSKPYKQDEIIKVINKYAAAQRLN
ncbi:response regulator [Vibrio sp. SM6]|uniref:Response regulator n=1 Tax=Vibrio agarilyticus TaxID=2726741 RepID=A0A7X8YHT1_9VIBR|nr:response regulator [Vibrio agarilyticus]NLS14423.1 response regulator [Vibrio agarilyticus]